MTLKPGLRTLSFLVYTLVWIYVDSFFFNPRVFGTGTLMSFISITNPVSTRKKKVTIEPGTHLLNLGIREIKKRRIKGYVNLCWSVEGNIKNTWEYKNTVNEERMDFERKTTVINVH